ncbi:MAG: hypothetical protein WC683_07635 [bacterium]|jgi:hypothetical protein
MSAKIHLYNALASGTAVEPKAGYVYVVTKVTFENEGDVVGTVLAGCPGKANLVEGPIQPDRGRRWEGTYVVEQPDYLTVVAEPEGSVRCIIEGYFLVDVQVFARQGAGSMDEAYASAGVLQIQDSQLAKMTYLTLVELKQIRAILEAQSGHGPDRDAAAAEVDRELGS